MRCGEIELDAEAVTVRSLASADSVILAARHPTPLTYNNPNRCASMH